MNQWMKRALEVAVLGGGLLAFSAGAAAAEDLSAGASARLGGPTAAEVRVCANGQVLSGLLGSCSGQGTSGSAQAGDGGVRARVGVPGTASADVSVGIRRSRPQATASGRATVAPRSDGSPRARASVQGDLSRPSSGELLDPRPLADLAGIGVLGTSLFTLAEATLAVPDLKVPTTDLPELTDPAPGLAGIGVLGSGPIASGNQVDAGIGDVAASVPLTVCGNGVGLLGDASVSCGQDTSTGGTTAPPVPGTTGGSDTSTGGITAPDPTGTTGTTGTTGLTPGTSGGPGGRISTFAPFRALAPAGSGALPFTGGASDLLALVAAGLLAAGALFLRAARPAVARMEGGGGR